MKKRILSMILSVVMVVGLMPGFAVTASAADGDTTTVEAKWGASADNLTKSGTLSEAITAVLNGTATYIRLNSDVLFRDDIEISDKEFTVDMNGHDLYNYFGSFELSGSAKMTVTDTGETLGEYTSEDYLAFVSGNATLIIEKGNYNGFLVDCWEESNVIIKGGTINASVSIGSHLDVNGDAKFVRSIEFSDGFCDFSDYENIKDITLSVTSRDGSYPVATYFALPNGIAFYDAGGNAVDTLEAQKEYTIKEAPAAPETPNHYNVTVSATPTEGGTVEGGGTFDAGASVTVTATANEGYMFTGWTKNGEQVSTDASYTFTMPASDVTVSATFVSCDHTGNINDSFTSDGKKNHSKICSVCGNAVETKDHEWVEGVCTGCNTLNAFLAGSNLTLEGVIGFNFFFEIDDDIINSISDGNEVVVQFTFPGADPIKIDVTKGKITQDGLYVYTQEVFAKQMADEIKVQVIMTTPEGDKYESTEYSHSVVKYAKQILNDVLKDTLIEELGEKSGEAKNEQLKDMMIEMLNYGASAQIYFDYHTENLANKDISKEQD